MMKISFLVLTLILPHHAFGDTSFVNTALKAPGYKLQLNTDFEPERSTEVGRPIVETGCSDLNDLLCAVTKAKQAFGKAYIGEISYLSFWRHNDSAVPDGVIPRTEENAEAKVIGVLVRDSDGDKVCGLARTSNWMEDEEMQDCNDLF